MSRITENIIEAFAIELLQKLGYSYIYAPDLAPEGEGASRSADQRESYAQVLLLDRLQKAVSSINRLIPAEAQAEAAAAVKRRREPFKARGPGRPG